VSFVGAIDLHPNSPSPGDIGFDQLVSGSKERPALREAFWPHKFRMSLTIEILALLLCNGYKAYEAYE
jgi:hypothetical protein